MTTPQAQPKHGIVKQVNSGDSVTIRGQPKGGPPPEKTVILSHISAPKLGRRTIGANAETQDEPFAWEAREFLRKLLIGKEAVFVEEKVLANGRTIGNVWLGKDIATGQNVTELLVSEGLVTVKRDVRNVPPELQKLQELEDVAKSAAKGRWSNSPSSAHVRDVKYVIDNPLSLVDKFEKKPVKAVIEHIRDGSTVKALLLPDYYHITLAISGIRCPGFKEEGKVGEPFAQEARFFVENRLLHRDVEVILEAANNNMFVGSILHPKGNIAEALLQEGFARCVDWSMNNIRSGAHKLYLAEKVAKEKRLRLWKNFVPAAAAGPQEEFTGVVTEIASAEAIIVKNQNGETKKVFLSSIRSPKGNRNTGEEGKSRKDFRPLYDIPWMFEAREFLRKKLIGKTVKVVVDYVQPARDNFPEKTCCTVTVGKINIAEAMVSKGYVTVLRYRQNDDQRSSHYNDLLAAEMKAEKSQNGLHAKKDVPLQRIRDVSTDPAGAKSHLQSLKRARDIKAVVEFVTSGSRLKLFVPKEYCLITFLLAGVKAPRAARITPGNGGMEAEPYGQEALEFTREYTLQKDVDIQVEGMESKGSGFIGWLFIDGVNLSVALVEEGLAEVSNFIEQGENYKLLKAAEENAKAKKLNIWKNRVQVEVETEKVEEERGPVERKVSYEEVVVSEITEDLHFYAQKVDQRNMLEGLLLRLRQELAANPPLGGAYNPKRGDIAVAKFSEDDQWYRVKVEKVSGPNVHVFYIDYGNREVLNVLRVAAIPAGFVTDKPYATEYILACVTLPKDNDDKKLALNAFRDDVITGKTLLLNIEYRVLGVPAATLVDPTTNEDIGKGLVTDGFVIVENHRDKRLQTLQKEYKAAEKDAMDNHRNIWLYGDIRDDDAKEFGIGR